MWWFWPVVLTGYKTDIEDRILPCWSSSWKPCCRQGWFSNILRFWNDGWDKIIHSGEITLPVLFCVWEGCKQGIILVFSWEWHVSSIIYFLLSILPWMLFLKLRCWTSTQCISYLHELFLAGYESSNWSGSSPADRRSLTGWYSVLFIGLEGLKFQIIHNLYFGICRLGGPYNFSWIICWTRHQISNRLWLQLERLYVDIFTSSRKLTQI